MSTLRTVWIIPTLALSLIASGIAHADVIVTANVTPNGGLFQYDYSITNQTADDLPVLDIAVTPDITIGDLTAPTGFETAYDPGLGLVSFLENTASFGSTPLSGFMFDSSVAPSATTFTATLQDLTTFAVSTMSGSTQGPVVPEPTMLMPCALGMAALFWRKRLLASRPR
jgi:hypothetical protein